MTPSGWKVFAQNIGGALGVITAAGIVIGIPMFVVVKTKFFNEMNIFSKGNEEPELETGQKLAEEAKGSPVSCTVPERCAWCTLMQRFHLHRHKKVA